MIESFAPIIPENARILILGTMPGAMSLQKQQYYGFPQNAFWKILFSYFRQADVPQNYSERVKLLHEQKIALWDVLANCDRKGSLDIHIKNQMPNNIPKLIQQQPTIEKILFNGKESYKYFSKSFPELVDFAHEVIPSTSPANTVKFTTKLEIWSEALTV